MFVLPALLTLVPPATGATVAYTLFGQATFPGGWGFVSGGETNPGPDLFADEGDTVDLTLTKEDAATHFWFLDYSGDGARQTDEPQSPSILVNTPASFTADRAGTFTYRCGIHVNGMRGTFQINATFPTATLLQPAGGLSWTGGSFHDITWDMTDPQSPVAALVAFLNYSYAGGTQTGMIAGSIPGVTNPHTYTWTVPAVNATDMLVNLTVIDPDGNKAWSQGVVPVVDSTPPAVTATLPVNNSATAPTTTDVRVTFDEPMDQPATEASATLLEVPSWNLVAVNAQPWSGNTMVLRPAAALASATTYQLNLTVVAKDVSDPGNSLASAYFVFTTANSPPTVAVSMPDGARSWTGGSSHDVVWTMTDESPLASLMTWINYTSSAGGGAIAGPLAGSANPHTQPWVVPLVDVTDMAVNVTVRDPDGGVTYVDALVPTVDSTAPSVSAVNPLNNSLAVSVSTAIDLTFDEAMNQTAAESAVTLLQLPAWTPVAVTIQGWSGNTLTLLPTVTLSPSTAYAVNVTLAATDASDPGNPLAFFSSGFTTGGAPPLVALTQPVGGEAWSTGSPHPVSWTLSDADTPLAAVTLCLYDSMTGPTGPWNLVSCFAGDTAPPFSYIAPAANTTAAHLRLTANDTANETESISPAFEIDNARPDILSRTPVPGEPSAPLNTNVVVVFTEDMDIPSATLQFGLQQQPLGQWVAGTITWPTNDTLIFDPTVDLLPATNYWGWMNQSAHDDTDPGNILAAGYIWQFDTGVVADTTPPMIVALPILPDPALPTQPVNISADVTDNVAVASVTIRVILSATEIVNQSMTAASAPRWYHGQAYAAVGTYDVMITAVDTSGIVSVHFDTFTIFPPLSIPLVEASPSPAEFPEFVNLFANVSTSFSGLQVWIDVTGLGNGSAAFDSISGRWFRGVTPAGLGTHTFTVWATDSSGAWASASGTFEVRDTTPPAVTNLTALPNPVMEAGTVITTINVTDLFTIADVRLVIFLGAVEVVNRSMIAGTPPSWSDTYARVGVGLHNFTITATDANGNSAQVTGNFTAVASGSDTTPPVITNLLVLPDPVFEAGTVTTTVDVTDLFPIAVVHLSVFLGAVEVVNRSMIAGTPPSWSDTYARVGVGLHDFTITATDANGNSASVTGQFTVFLPVTPPALWGEAASGWGATPTTISQPGPTLVYNASESVSLTVVGFDDQFHFLFVDLNANGVMDLGEPGSFTVRGNSTVLAFTAPGAGDYTYYCGIHPTMSGTLRVLGTDDAGPPVLLYLVIIVLVVGGIVAFVVLRLRRRNAAPGSEEPVIPEDEPAPEDTTDENKEGIDEEESA